MSIKVNEALLDDRLAALEAVRPWSPRLVSKLENHIRTSDDRELLRVNPLAFAEEKLVHEDEVIDLFLYATSLGLFEMNWMLMCPLCSGVVESFAELKGLHSHYYCNVCAAEFQSRLDEFIAVSFTINPEIRDTKFHHPEALSPRDYFFDLCAATEGRMEDGTPFVRAQEMVTRHVNFLDPGETERVTIEAEEGILFGVSHGSTADTMWFIEGAKAADAHSVDIVYTDDNRERGVQTVAPGRISVAISNQTSRRDAFVLALLPPAFANGRPVLHFRPFLSGKRLITRQTFRELFRSEVIQAREGIEIKDITLLFTDLKGSTALYDRIGDLNAFSLVQQHFDKLQAVSIRHNGAIVKTIGDAVMASFLDPVDAVRAALEMQAEIDEFNRSRINKDLVLKIGVHTGAAIAVTLNERLDYFGQTVNIAARVQDLADADEIFLSADVYEDTEVASALSTSNVDQRDVTFKGLDHELRVYRVTSKTLVPSAA